MLQAQLVIHDVIAYHLRQAFKPGEVTPEEANRIGRELALKLTKGNHALPLLVDFDPGRLQLLQKFFKVLRLFLQGSIDGPA